MENKYYTPTIEEFHVGFEYEALWGIENIDGEWLKETFSEKSSISSLEEKVRVKLLDREDAESLGWIFDNNLSIGFINLENRYSYSIAGVYGTEYDSISISEINEKGIIQFLFHGKIKNKSELQKLLTQLGIK